MGGGGCPPGYLNRLFTSNIAQRFGSPVLLYCVLCINGRSIKGSHTRLSYEKHVCKEHEAGTRKSVRNI